MLDAALDIFAEGGFSDASMAAIAERARVSKAVLYDCFPRGKQEIYYALHERVEEHYMEYMLDVLDRVNKMPLEAGLRQGLLKFFEYARRYPSRFRLIFGEAGTSDPEIAQQARRTKERIVAKMGERTREIMEAVGIEITPLADVYNRSIVAVAEELARWTLLNPTIPAETLIDLVVSWWMKGFERIIPRELWKNGVSAVRA